MKHIKKYNENYSRISMNIFFQNTDNISKINDFSISEKKNIQQILSDELLNLGYLSVSRSDGLQVPFIKNDTSFNIIFLISDDNKIYVDCNYFNGNYYTCDDVASTIELLNSISFFTNTNRTIT